MKKLFYLLPLISLLSCKEEETNPDKMDIDRFTEKIELRQLVNTAKINKSVNGSYFLVVGSYSAQQTQTDIVKVFGKIDDSYRLLEFKLSDTRIVVSDTIKEPYIKLKYNCAKSSIEHVLTQHWCLKEYYIYCPENLLPEKLLPIEIK